jgi:UDP-3-O-[3-hydroxymyristoyl] glucosamine N-acyltransferase
MLASELALRLNGRLLGDDLELYSLKALHQALKTDLSFLLAPTELHLAKKSQAGLIIMSIDCAADYLDELLCAVIAVEDLFLAFGLLRDLQLSGHFVADLVAHTSIHKTAKIHKSAHIGKAIIEAQVQIAENAVIADHVRIAEGSIIGPNTVIGQEAFAPFGINTSQNLPSLGSVLIGKNTRIAALCSIDRGLISATALGENCLVDNMVHIGHDVEIGDDVLIAAQSGIAGFARLDRAVVLGGQVGIAPYVHIGAYARISGKSGVHCDIPSYQIWSGNPSMPHKQYLKASAQIKRQARGNK